MITASGKRVGRPPRVEEEARRAAEPPIRRWTAADCDGWILHRLKYQWEGSDLQWRTKLIGFAGSNEHLFVTNGEAVLLAFVLRHPMTGKPIVMETFAWSRMADERDGVYEAMPRTEGEQMLKSLYRYMREWAKGMGATRIYVGVCSDILPSQLKDALGKDSYYLVAGPP